MRIHLPLVVLVAVLASLLAGCASGGAVISQVDRVAPRGTGFLQRSLTRDGRTRLYAVFVPFHYDPHLKYPVIVFLHGLGEGGSDATANVGVGLGPAIAAQADTFPFIAIFPQSGDGTWHADSEWAGDAIAALDDVSRAYSVDPDRVILTGLSTGGYGTWAIGAKYHTRFAALVPLCAYAADEKDISTLATLPIWAFHNGGDPFVFASDTTSTCAKINKAGGNAKCTIFSNIGHDCWTQAYADPALYRWMLQQRRRNP